MHTWAKYKYGRQILHSYPAKKKGNNRLCVENSTKGVIFGRLQRSSFKRARWRNLRKNKSRRKIKLVAAKKCRKKQKLGTKCLVILDLF
jgi:hypothetical protein